MSTLTKIDAYRTYVYDRCPDCDANVYAKWRTDHNGISAHLKCNQAGDNPFCANEWDCYYSNDAADNFLPERLR